MEKLFHKKPAYSFLKTFDCLCYNCLRPYNNHKLQPRLTPCVFIYYNNIHKGYKCLSLDGHLYVSRHVFFDENTFPFSNKSFTTSPSSSVSSILPNISSSHTLPISPSTSHYLSSSFTSPSLPTTSIAPSPIHTLDTSFPSPYISTSPTPVAVKNPNPTTESAHTDSLAPLSADNVNHSVSIVATAPQNTHTMTK